MLFNVKYVLSVFVNQQQTGMPWWVWFLLIIVIIFLFVLLWRWLGLSKGGEQPGTFAAAPVAKSKPLAAAPAVAAPEREEESTLIAKKPKPEAPAPAAKPVEESTLIAKKPKPDDLTLIEGIGPKIASVLQGVGIKTFDQLAKTEVGMLEGTLKAANMRLADPASWPEQARLAADGKLDELKTLQDNLKGGRRA